MKKKRGQITFRQLVHYVGIGTCIFAIGNMPARIWIDLFWKLVAAFGINGL